MSYFLKSTVITFFIFNQVIDEKLKELNKMEEKIKETNEIVNKMSVELKRNQLQNEEIVEKITKTMEEQNLKILQELLEIKENQKEINLYFKQLKENKSTKIEKQNKMFIKFEKYF
jgi:glutamine synthetase